MAKQDNFLYLLLGLLFVLIVPSALSDIYTEKFRQLSSISFTLIMIFGIWSLIQHRLWFYAGIGLAVAGIVMSTINFFLDKDGLFTLNLFVVCIFCILSTIAAMRQVLFTGKITINKLLGSVSIYLLIGISWGFFYEFIYFFYGEVFSGIDFADNNQRITDFIYYSFVTLTTLGYGEIAPLHPLARSLAYLEAILGQFYIAILVASLVTAYLSERTK